MAEILKSVLISDELIVPIATTTANVNHATPIQKHQALNQEEIYNDGYNNGLKAGIQQAYSELREKMNTLTSVLNNLPKAIENHRLQLSNEIADIVFMITQRLFINQQQNKDELINEITQILQHLNHQQHIEIALHPEDLTTLQQHKINLNLKQHKNTRLIPDKTLRLGGFMIHTEHGVFDASIERQIDNLKQVLLNMKQNSSGV